MALTKTEGLILKTRRQGETSKILIIYTRDFGKITLIGKGSRSTKSRHWGALEPFTHVAVVFYHKKNREIQFLSQADILASFTSLHSQLGKLMLASVVCELVDRAEAAETVNLQLFRLLLETIDELDRANSGLRNIVRSFQLKLVGLLGYEPELAHCAQCGKSEPTDRVGFDLSSGRYYCHECFVAATPSLPLKAFVLEMMLWLQHAPINKVSEAKVTKQVGKEIDSFINTYMQYHIEGLGTLKSLTTLNQISDRLENLA